MIEDIEEFTYLEGILNKDSGTSDDIQNGIKKAQQAFGQLRLV